MRLEGSCTSRLTPLRYEIFLNFASFILVQPKNHDSLFDIESVEKSCATSGVTHLKKTGTASSSQIPPTSTTTTVRTRTTKVCGLIPTKTFLPLLPTNTPSTSTVTPLSHRTDLPGPSSSTSPSKPASPLQSTSPKSYLPSSPRSQRSSPARLMRESGLSSRMVRQPTLPTSLKSGSENRKWTSGRRVSGPETPRIWRRSRTCGHSSRSSSAPSAMNRRPTWRCGGESSNSISSSARTNAGSSSDRCLEGCVSAAKKILRHQ